MIEKLSDERIKEIAKEIKDADSSYGNVYYKLIGAMNRIKNYYDAQIDAQAKTIEELYMLFKTMGLYGCNEAFEYGVKINLPVKERQLFDDVIGFYVAAGGRIKE